MRTEISLREAVDDLADQAPSGDAVLRNLAAARRRDQQRRRRTVLVLAGAVATVVALLAITLPLLVSRPVAEPARTPTPVPTDQRVPGNWSMVSTVTPPAGWRVAQREVYVDSEQTVLQPTGSTEQQPSCYVGVEQDDATPPSGRALRLGGQQGHLTDEGTFGFTLQEMWVSVSCGGMKDEQAMIAEVVPGVRLAHQDIRVPFSLSDLPADLEVKTVYDGDSPDFAQSQGVDLGSSVQAGGPGSITIRVATDPIARAEAGGFVLQRLTVGGRDAAYNADVGLCFTGKVALCLGDNGGELGPAEAGSPISATMRQLAEAVTPAPDLADRATWPTGLEAIPR